MLAGVGAKDDGTECKYTYIKFFTCPLFVSEKSIKTLLSLFMLLAWRITEQ